MILLVPPGCAAGRGSVCLTGRWTGADGGTAASVEVAARARAAAATCAARAAGRLPPYVDSVCVRREPERRVATPRLRRRPE